MTYMKNYMEIIKKELFYQLKSKGLLILILITISITFLHVYGLYNSVLNNYNRYLKTEQSYKENNMDILEALKEENDPVKNGNTTITNNPIKEDFLKLATSIQNLDQGYIISNSLEYFIFVFGTMIFGIYAAYIATYDYKYRIHKFFSIKYKPIELLIGKILSTLLVLLLNILVMGLISYFASPILKSLVNREVPIENFIIPGLEYNNNIGLQLIFTISLLGFYILISCIISYILKNMLPCTLFIIAYTILIPVLGKYDIKNIYSFFAHKIFSFQSRFRIMDAIEISPICGIGFIVLMIISSFIALIAISKRSLYS